ncbi:nadph oxidase organizer 1 [Limosa lapponica baueri]|uniref:Nadph oxidase organizer 1 n=1 Tax=Limosa lapponica baueri TaxID=1758121 RepID=A0A2I0TK56_LIMLA|nr:nadph oxidase organizer 1 [Limosa lapponica baueri]
MNCCLEILKLLETYSQELLKTEAKISQGGDVIRFFKAQTQDLDPSFPENSVVIMPSEIGGGKKNQPGSQLSITRPQVSQSYRCIETFETKDTKNQKFKVAAKEIVEVLIKDMTGTFDRDSSVSGTDGKSDDGWWLIRYNGCTGYMPSMYLQPYKNPHHKLQTIMSSGLNNSTPNLASSLTAPQPQAEATGQHRIQACSSLDQTEEDMSSLRSRSRSLPRASSTPDLESDSSSLSLGSSNERDSRLNWKPELSRSLPEVEQARMSPLEHTLATHSSKSPHLTHKDRNDSGFVESSAADLSNSLTDPDLATCVPKVPVRPSAHEILQKCSTVTKRAVQQSSTRPALQTLRPSVH